MRSAEMHFKCLNVCASFWNSVKKQNKNGCLNLNEGYSMQNHPSEVNNSIKSKTLTIFKSSISIPERMVNNHYDVQGLRFSQQCNWKLWSCWTWCCIIFLVHWTHKNEGNTFLQDAGKHSPNNVSITSQKTTVHILRNIQKY
jgi:hypothetical protein